jgi:hypothetical protein
MSGVGAVTDIGTLNHMKLIYGQEVINHQESFAMQGSQASKIISTMREYLSQRNIPNVSVDNYNNNRFNYTIITQSLGSGNKATTAIRVDTYGNDLLIDFHHYEQAATHTRNMKIWGGILCLVIGPPALVIMGAGLLPIAIGFWMLTIAKYSFPGASTERQASQLLFKTALETLEASMKNCGVSPNAQMDINF